MKSTHLLIKQLAYRNDQANLNAAKDHTNVGAHAHAKIDLIDLPEMDSGFVVDQAKHCRDDY